MSLLRGRAFVAILIAAALFRFAFSAYVVGFGAMTKSDEADYHAIAANLVASGTFAGEDGRPTGRRPPAYPLFLAAIYELTGPRPVAGRIAQVLLGVAVVALTVLLARRIFDTATALAAGALVAINPFLTFISGYLLTENLYLVFLLAALCVVARPADVVAVPARRAVGAGLLLALAALVRPSGVPFAEWVVAAVVLVVAAPWRRRFTRAALLGAVFALALVPWYARNAAVVGGWVLTTHGGITFYQGNNQKVARTAQWRGGAAPLEVLPRYDELASMPEIDRDRLAWRLGREYLEHQWREIPGLVGWKLVRFWRIRSEMGLSGIRSGWWWSRDSTLGRLASELDVGMIYAVVMFPLFAIGAWLTRRRWRDLVLLYGVVVIHTAVAAVFFGSLRGRIPVEPIVCVFAGAAVVSAMRAVGSRRAASPAR